MSARPGRAGGNQQWLSLPRSHKQLLVLNDGHLRTGTPTTYTFRYNSGGLSRPPVFLWLRDRLHAPFCYTL
jgi:hypothetical protein